MECLLCAMWERLPHAKKPTTPTTSTDTEGALALGYWLARRDPEGRICERHTAILRVVIERFLDEGSKAESQPPAHVQHTPFELGLKPLLNENSNTDLPPMIMAVDLAAPYRKNNQQVNPGEEELTDPYKRILATQRQVAAQQATQQIQSQVQTQVQPTPVALVSALEAAKAPPTEGAKVAMICPLCGEMTVTGEVHAC